MYLMLTKYIVYGEWKVYNNNGLIGILSSDKEVFTNLANARTSYAKLIMNEIEYSVHSLDYDLIYLDVIENDYQDNLECWERKGLFI